MKKVRQKNARNRFLWFKLCQEPFSIMKLSKACKLEIKCWCWEWRKKNYNLLGAIDEFFTMLNLGCWIYRFFVSQSSVGSTTVSSISLSFRGRPIRWSISRISRCRYCRRWLLWCCILWLLSWWLLICVYVYRCWRRDAVDVIVSRTGSCCIVVSVSCEKLKDDLNFKRSKMMDLNFIDLG